MIGVIKSFDTSAIDTLDFNKIRRDLFPVLNKKDNFQLDERTMDEFISEAMRTDIKIQCYGRFYRPSLFCQTYIKR